MSNKLIELKDAGPQHLEIHPRFCLNKKTLIWYADKRSNKSTKTNNNKNKTEYISKNANAMKDIEEEQKHNDSNNHENI